MEETIEEGAPVEAGGVEFENGSTVTEDTAAELSGGRGEPDDVQ